MQPSHGMPALEIGPSAKLYSNKIGPKKHKKQRQIPVRVLLKKQTRIGPDQSQQLCNELMVVKEVKVSEKLGTDKNKMWNLTLFLCVVWSVSLLYGEMFAFWVPSLWSCSWPHDLPPRSSFPTSPMEGLGVSGDFVKIVVLADPQLMDKTSNDFLAPNSLGLEIAQFYTDLFMRRAFLASVLPFNPDAILFLGDYIDGGPVLSDEEWQASLSRFKHIFDLNTRGRSTEIPVYHIPGNHDIGYAGAHSHTPEVIERYEKEFGLRNYRFTIGKVEFIAIDAQTIDGHPDKELTAASWEFVKNVSMDDKLKARVLLTHIPLYRPDWTPCGPHRSTPVINQRVSRAGHIQDIVYQNYVTEESSNRILDLIRPVLVLSGHDHDQCTATHMSKSGPIQEHTLGTISWQQGNFYPSFMLLSASSNVSTPEVAVSSELCFLPTQLHIYIWYLSLYVITVLALLLQPTNSMVFWHHISDAIGCTRKLMSVNIFRGDSKEKIEDEECEYEMIWDAEGSMHLVKKPMNVPLKSITSSGRGSAERGNAVMRPAAKKQSSEDVVIPMTGDMNMDVGVDSMVKLPPRTSKSKTKMVIQRLVRTFRSLTVIAAVNVPLYMMLLFKDWIN